MTLAAIILGTLTCGVGSVFAAFVLTKALLSRYQQHMLSLAAGALLATAFLHLLPEAFGSGASPSHLFMTLLVGLIFFFLLDKAELWHHGHEHGGHSHGHDHDANAHAHADSGDAKVGGWSVLLGDSVHAFGDGIMVAGAFMADLNLGYAASMAVLAHEIPHHMGDLTVLTNTGGVKNQALLKLSLSGLVTTLGGLLAYALLEGREFWVPYMLSVASSSYLYVALADLIPQLQKRLSAQATVHQILWLFSGMALVNCTQIFFH
ncbi:MAG: ZIP family metal transporter [Betaproteobacteria bacterium]